MTGRPALTLTIEKHESPYYSPKIVNGLIQTIPVGNMYICILNGLNMLSHVVFKEF